MPIINVRTKLGDKKIHFDIISEECKDSVLVAISFAGTLLKVTGEVSREEFTQLAFYMNCACHQLQIKPGTKGIYHCGHCYEWFVERSPSSSPKMQEALKKLKFERKEGVTVTPPLPNTSGSV